MADIKTRDVTKGTIKTLDKAAATCMTAAFLLIYTNMISQTSICRGIYMNTCEASGMLVGNDALSHT